MHRCEVSTPASSLSLSGAAVLSEACWAWGAVLREMSWCPDDWYAVHSGIAGMRIKALHPWWAGGGEDGRLKNEKDKRLSGADASVTSGTAAMQNVDVFEGMLWMEGERRNVAVRKPLGRIVEHL